MKHSIKDTTINSHLTYSVQSHVSAYSFTVPFVFGLTSMVLMCAFYGRWEPWGFYRIWFLDYGDRNTCIVADKCNFTQPEEGGGSFFFLLTTTTWVLRNSYCEAQQVVSQCVGSHNSIAANDYTGQGRWGTPTRGRCGQRAMNPYLKTQSNWGVHTWCHTPKPRLPLPVTCHVQQK